MACRPFAATAALHFGRKPLFYISPHILACHKSKALQVLRLVTCTGLPELQLFVAKALLPAQL